MDLPQQVKFTGTSAFNERAYVDVQGSTSLLTGSTGGDTLTFGPFTLSYSGTPSSMVLDACFVQDLMLSTPVPGLASGDHTVAVEVRSVLLGGPPVVGTITGPATFSLG